MGHKVHPLGFRLGIIRNWDARWYADRHYGELLREDLALRGAIRKAYPEGGVSTVEIDRQSSDVTITVHTSRPGIIIGRGGQRVDETRQQLEKIAVGKKVHLNVQEIRQPELDAYLVAKSIADQLGRRVAYRRAIKQAAFRTMQAGAKGIKVTCAGRLGGAEIARRESTRQGRVPLHTLRADINYGLEEAHTLFGRIGVKVWIYKGDVYKELPAAKLEEEAASAPTEGATKVAEQPVAASSPLVGEETVPVDKGE